MEEKRKDNNTNLKKYTVLTNFTNIKPYKP